MQVDVHTLAHLISSDIFRCLHDSNMKYKHLRCTLVRGCTYQTRRATNNHELKWTTGLLKQMQTEMQTRMTWELHIRHAYSNQHPLSFHRKAWLLSAVVPYFKMRDFNLDVHTLAHLSSYDSCWVQMQRTNACATQSTWVAIMNMN